MNRLRTINILIICVLVMTSLTVGFTGFDAEISYADNEGYTSAEGNHHGSSNYMTILDGSNADKKVTEIDKTRLSYAVSIGSSGSMTRNSSTNAIFVNDRLFVVGGGQLKEIEPDTGEILCSSGTQNPVNNLYNYFIISGDNKIFVQCGKTVKSFEIGGAKGELGECKTSKDSFEGTQGLCRLCYSDGKVYGATLAPHNAKAEMFCLNASDMSTVWKYSFEKSCEKSKWNGAYWTGATAIGDYIVFGSEGGRLYSFAKSACENENLTIEPVDTYDIGENYGIKSGIAFCGENGEKKLYFTANDYTTPSNPTGDMFELDFNSETGEFTNSDQKPHRSIRLSGYTAATPAICDGKAYTSAGGAIKIIDITEMKLIQTIVTGQNKLYDFSLIKDADTIYGYATYYKTPGSIIGFADTGIKDKNTEDKFRTFDLQVETKEYGAQYGAAQITIGADGCLYFTNDSGKLMKIEGRDTSFTSIKDMTVNLQKNKYTYDGKEKKPQITIEGLAINKDYTVSYTNNTEPGTATVTVEGIGEYKHKTTKTFAIVYYVPKVSIKKPSAGKKSVTVNWKKLSAANQKQVSGIQVMYSTSSKFKSAKTVNAKKSATSKKIKKLKAKKKYYVKVRAYSVYKSKKYYSSWSAVKSIKTK